MSTKAALAGLKLIAVLFASLAVYCIASAVLN